MEAVGGRVDIGGCANSLFLYQPLVVLRAHLAEVACPVLCACVRDHSAPVEYARKGSALWVSQGQAEDKGNGVSV